MGIKGMSWGQADLPLVVGGEDEVFGGEAEIAGVMKEGRKQLIIGGGEDLKVVVRADGIKGAAVGGRRDNWICLEAG